MVGPVRAPLTAPATIAILMWVMGMASPAGAAPPPVCNAFPRFDPERCVRPTELPKREGAFHLGAALAVEAGWDSNALRAAPAVADPDAFVLSLKPRVEMETPTPRTVDFSLVVGADLRFFAPGLEALGAGEAAGVSADTRLEVGPRSVFGLVLRERLRRRTDSEDRAIAWPYAHIWNAVGGGLRIGERQSTRLELGYDYILQRYADEASYASSSEHALDLLFSWPFHEKGTLYLDARLALRTWEEPTAASDEGAMPLTVVAGIAGYPFTKLLALLEVGYGDSFHEDLPRFRHAVARASITWRFTTRDYLGFGYERSFLPSTWGRYTASDRMVLRGGFGVGGLVSIAADVGFELIEHGRHVPQTEGDFASHEYRTANVLSASLRVEVQASGWLVAYAAYSAELGDSNFRFQTYRQTASDVQSSWMIWDYTRQRAHVGLEARL